MKMGILLSEEVTERLMAIARYEETDCLTVIENAIDVMSAVLEDCQDG